MTAPQQNSTLDVKMSLELWIVYVQLKNKQLLFDRHCSGAKSISLINFSQQNPINALCNRSTERNYLFGVKHLPLNHKSLKNFSLLAGFPLVYQNICRALDPSPLYEY